MKWILIFLGGFMLTTAHAKSGFYNFNVNDIDGKKTDLGKYEGKVAVVVNTASKCGFTPQYKGLQELYDKYKDKGLVVLGFPSNDFGAQEPGSNAEIKQFCELKYKVSFPMFEKVVVKGDGKQAVYQYLTEKSQFPGEIQWNFEKFVIDRKGNVIGRFNSKVKPESPEVSSLVEKALNEKG